MKKFTLFAMLACMLPFAPARAQNVALPELRTHENYLDEISRTDALDVNDPMKVFAFVLNSLSGGVHVYPTENYYYFRFLHNGVPWSGNIRIEVGDGPPSLHFAYYQTETPWRPDESAKEIVLGDAAGVTFEKKDRFLYRVAYQNKSVLFALNDLSKLKPPPSALAPDERLIGPIFDESGLRFFLIFNDRLKDFLYILDETAKPAEEFFPRNDKSRILIGKRTGFAFFRDQKLERKILIGVFEDNLLLNTWYDGPFDQLPDNFIEGESLRSAIIAANPQMAGKIDRFGRAYERPIRYAIKPYLAYVELSDLDAVEACANRRENDPAYYDCFNADKLEASAKAEPKKHPSAKKREAPRGKHPQTKHPQK